MQSPTAAKPVTVCVKAHGNFGIIAEFTLPGTATVGAVAAMLADRGLRRRKIVLASKLPDRAPESMGGFRLLPEAVNPSDVLHESRLVSDNITSDGVVHLLYLGSFEEDYLPLRDRREQEPDAYEVRVAEALEGPGRLEEPVRTADDVRHYKVVAPMVCVRSAPSTVARKLGGLAMGDIVSGWAYKVGVEPWLRLEGAARPSWALIHGACLDLGQLLEVCDPGFRPPPAGPARRRAARGVRPEEPSGEPRAQAGEEDEETQLADAAKPQQVPQELADMAVDGTPATWSTSQTAHEDAPQEPVDAVVEGTPATWSTSQTAEFFRSLGFISAVPEIVDNCVDGQVLVNLTDEDLKTELGFRPLEIKKIRLLLEQYNS